MKEAEFSLAGFAAFAAEEMMDNVEHAREQALELGAKMIRDEAKRVIGTYDYGWQQLAESTKRDRVDKGFPENEPLLRDGTLRESIHFTILKAGVEAEIGSNSDVAVYQELGTSTIPARSFLAGAAAHEGKQVAKVIGAAVSAALADQSIAGEIAKLAVEALTELRDDAKELLLESGEEQDHGHHGR